MADIGDLVMRAGNTLGSDDQRKFSVAAALEVIAAKASAGGENDAPLANDMDNLSEYANLIEAALKRE